MVFILYKCVTYAVRMYTSNVLCHAYVCAAGQMVPTETMYKKLHANGSSVDSTLVNNVQKHDDVSPASTDAQETDALLVIESPVGDTLPLA